MAKRKYLASLGIAVLAVGYGAYALTRPLPAISTKLTIAPPAAQAVSLAWPGTQSALGAEDFGLLAQHGSQKPVPIASTAKLVTVLSVLHKYPLSGGSQGPIITLGTKDVGYYLSYKNVGGSVVKVQSGEQLSELQAIQAMLLPSANNIAESLAVWAFGSMQNYLTFANQYAATLGLTQTHMADASGFSPLTTSTAVDLVKLGLITLKNPVIGNVAVEKSAELPVVGTVYNVNWLLGTDGINGIKTGNSDQAGGCYLFSATHEISGQKVTLVGAVVGATDLNAAITAGSQLNNTAMSNFSFRQIAATGQTVGYYSTAWSVSYPIKAYQALSGIFWRPAPGTLQLNSNQLVWQQNNQKKQTVEITPPSSIAPPSLLWRLTHPLVH